MIKQTLLAAAFFIGALSFTACSDAKTEGNGDAGSDTHGVDSSSYPNQNMQNNPGNNQMNDTSSQNNNGTNMNNGTQGTNGNGTGTNNTTTGDTTGGGTAGRPNGQSGAGQQYDYKNNYNIGGGYTGGSYMKPDNYKKTTKSKTSTGSGSNSGQSPAVKIRLPISLTPMTC